MIRLLDVEIFQIIHTIPDTSRVVPKPVFSDSVAHTIASSDISDDTLQLADVASIYESSGLIQANLLWTILVVLCALCLCFYFVRKYRSQQNQ